MVLPVKKTDRRYTYEDYRTWPNDERWEIIDGTAWAMTPAPSVKHQSTMGNTFLLFGAFFKEKACKAFLAPTDVVLDDENVVQPDLLVVCDERKITEANIRGAPDLVVEILSPTTQLKDRREKKALYERYGVREYLILQPEAELLERYRLVGTKYEGPDLFGWNETVQSHAFEGLELRLWEIFGRTMPAAESL